jgi:hypothetical protein
MIPTIVFFVLVALGVAFLIYGPQSWRTVILHSAVVALGGLGSLLDMLGAFDWRQLFDASTAAAVILAISVLGLIYRLYTTSPVGSPAPPGPKSA